MHDLLHWVHIQVNFICMPFGLETLCFIPTALRKDSAKIISQLKVHGPLSQNQIFIIIQMMRHHQKNPTTTTWFQISVKLVTMHI